MATGPEAAGALTAYPSGARPSSSDVSFVKGRTAENLTNLKLTNGGFYIYNSAGHVNVVIDVFGWFASTEPEKLARFVWLIQIHGLRCDPGHTDEVAFRFQQRQDYVMVQRRIVELVDDLDGGDADETVSFGLDGKLYELDLSSANAEQLRKLLAPYVSSGRRAGSAVAGRIPRPGAGPVADTAVVRQWALANGYEVNSRGRIPAPIRLAFESR